MDFFIESRYTLEESRRFARVINHRSPRFWIARCLVPVLMIAYSIFLLQKEMYMIAGFFFLVMMLLVGLGEYLRDYRSRKLWEESAVTSVFCSISRRRKSRSTPALVRATFPMTNSLICWKPGRTSIPCSPAPRASWW